jgi:gas vesicle protein
MRHLPWAAAPARWPLVAAAYGAGVATGATAALMFAPMTGAQLRQRLSKKARAMAGARSEPFKAVGTEVEQLASSLFGSADEQAHRQSDKPSRSSASAS